jgi:uncharacterized protein (TIGR02118 family)
MVKLVFIVYRNPELTKEEFTHHWLNVHAPLVQGMQDTIRIRRYVQSHLMAPEVNAAYAAARGIELHEFPDGIAEAWWDSPEDMDAAFATEEGEKAAAIMLEDERTFVDHARSGAFFTEETTIIAGVAAAV